MCRGTRGRHTPPAPFLLQVGPSNEDAAPQKEDRVGPETRTRDVYNHKAPTGVSVDIITNRQIKKLNEGFGGHKARKNCRCEYSNSADKNSKQKKSDM